MAATPKGASLRVEGYRELLIACDNAERNIKKGTRDALRHAGDAVKQGATDLFGKYDARSAAGYRTRVRRTGVAVEQSIRRTTGKRPDFGALQMRTALVPSLEEHEAETVELFEHALDVIAHQFETEPPS